jgi:hypothetical protein
VEIENDNKMDKLQTTGFHREMNLNIAGNDALYYTLQ